MKSIYENNGSGKNETAKTCCADSEYASETSSSVLTPRQLRKRYGKELRAMEKNPVSFADISDLDTCSATDCTGLIPSLPQSEAEQESYEMIHHMLPKIPGPEKTGAENPRASQKSV